MSLPDFNFRKRAKRLGITPEEMERAQGRGLKIIKGIAAGLSIFLTIIYVWSIIFAKQMDTTRVRMHIGKNVSAFQEIGKTDKKHTAYTGNKNGKAYVWCVNDHTLKVVGKEPILIDNTKKVSYLTKVQLYKNFKNKYKVNKHNEIIINNKKYLPIYDISTNAKIKYLRLAKPTKKDSKKVKRINLKDTDLYITDKDAIRNTKKKFKINLRDCVISDVKAKKNGSIYYYLISTKPKTNIYRLIIEKNNYISIAKGHTKTNP